MDSISIKPTNKEFKKIFNPHTKITSKISNRKDQTKLINNPNMNYDNNQNKHVLF